MFTPTSPVTGSAITGLTSPTYTLAADTAASIYGKKWIVSGLGGTQAGVSAHTQDSIFTADAVRPASAGKVSYNASGSVKSVPINTYSFIVRKDVLCAPGVYRTAKARAYFDIPAGSVANDPQGLNALFSLFGGLTTQQLQGLRDTATIGVL